MMMVREKISRSWFDRQGARLLAAEFAGKLEERMKNRKGIFLTLTYDRNNYQTPGELYQAQKDERHVRRFIARLEAEMGIDLTGKWCRKMEFQKGGWVHFHLVIDYRWIPQVTIAKCWGHGYVWVNAVTPKRISYLAKYAFKVDKVPTYLLGERARSVRIVATSPGFWPCVKTDQPRTIQRSRKPFGVTVGAMLTRRKASCILKLPNGHFTTVAVSLYETLSFSPSQGSEGPWHRIDAVPAGLPAGRRLHLTEAPDPPNRIPWIQEVSYLE